MTIDRESKTYRRILRGLETLFLALVGLYLLYRLSKSTTLRLAWPEQFEMFLLRGLVVSALLRLLTGKLLRGKTLVAAALAAIYCMVYRSDGYRFLLFLAAITVGCVDIDHRRILRTFLLTVGVFYCVVVVSGLLGLVTNYVYTRQGRGVRSAWGISYPTDFASLGLFILLALWAGVRRLPDRAMLVLCVGFMLLSGLIARSSTSLICGGLFLCAVLYHGFERRVIDGRGRLRWMKKGVDLYVTFAFPLLALAMFALMLMYARGMNAALRIDSLLSKRLRLGVDAWRLHGLSAFGTPFQQNGNGFSVFPSNDYNFVDSSYPLILLRYGWVLFIALGATWCAMARRVIRQGDRRLALAMGVIAFHAFAEHHFMDCHFNILLVMPLAAFAAADGEASAAPAEGADGGRRLPAAALAAAATGLLFIAVAWAAGPTLLSWLRTVLEYKHLGHGEHSLRLACVIFGALCATAVAAWSVYRLLAALLAREGIRRCAPALTALALCAALGCGAGLYADRAIAAAARESAPLVEADREALEIAVEAASGGVYSGVLPAVYRRQIPGMRYAAFFEDDLARLRGSTFLMPTGEERAAFLDSGCLYIRVSDEHALYTGDRGVVEALARAGYHPTGYYSDTWEVDLAEAAERNDLALDDAGLRVDSLELPLWDGPYYSLYEGRYTATWELALGEDAPAEGDVCVLGVTAYKGETVLLEKEVSAERFDGDGRLSVSVPFSIQDTRNVAFTVRLAGRGGVRVLGIRLERTPDFDVHTYYDGRMRAVRVEYYDLEGRPAAQSGGIYGYEQGYDRYGNVAMRRYLDADGAPTLRRDGCAEVRWAYNARRQVVKESFYGTDGSPVMISSRQAANEREYDGAGNVAVMRYLDVDGRPSVTTMGYAELRRSYDGKGQIVREEYYGADGQPLAQTSGYSAMEQDYDGAGNVIARRFFDGGEPVLRTDGYAEVRWQYNGLHQITREAFFGVDGEPVAGNVGYAADEREYDAAGNEAVYRYYDASGAPTLIEAGYAEVRRVYDDRKRVVEEAYFGTDGLPILLEDGYARWEKEYDAHGGEKAQRFYGAQGERVLAASGYFEVRRQFDGAGRELSAAFFDTEGAPVACARGYAEVRHAYNELDAVAEDAYFGPDGQPVQVRGGYARITYEYDGERQLLLTHYLDAEGNPVQAGSGYLHEYLLSLAGQDVTIFIAAKDEATNALTPVICEDLAALGIRTDLRGRRRNSFYAVVSADGVAEEIGSQAVLSREGTVGGAAYAIESAGYQVGNYCSIRIDGVEYAKNRRGLNIVVYDNRAGEVVDSVAFDTHVQEMTVRR